MEARQQGFQKEERPAPDPVVIPSHNIEVVSPTNQSDKFPTFSKLSQVMPVLMTIESASSKRSMPEITSKIPSKSTFNHSRQQSSAVMGTPITAIPTEFTRHPFTSEPVAKKPLLHGVARGTKSNNEDSVYTSRKESKSPSSIKLSISLFDSTWSMLDSD
ncbi:hypothetical protein CVT26_005118 [Gymnopilus dilepis]|uniref:Uncharacterized protein n=1 Tax=Gymnopilus dilepis TaxID=231916 RepID=A0A409WBY3_9AGAR|nr:hypothetical protein CVT26_005118 [Gymnopilus dilepis]